MEEVTGASLVKARYPDRLVELKARGVGLWDVIGSAERRGSLDADIASPVANDILKVMSSLSLLQAIAFNGVRAFEIGRRLLGPEERAALLKLPSSSPANTMSFERKRAAWLVLRGYLEAAPGAKGDVASAHGWVRTDA
jgi:hypoxanthine-DNA glycosylase